MPEIDFKEAKEILNSINDKDNVAVIHHDDGDGFCSGVIYYEWCKRQGAEVEEFTYTINKTKLREFNLSKFNKLIVTDLASDFMAEELLNYDDKEILYLDHHPKKSDFSDNVKYFITEEKYIPAARTAGELTELMPLLALTGTITDTGYNYPENDEFIESHLEKFDMTLEEFRQKVSSVITNTILYFDDDYKAVFQFINSINKIEDLSSIEKYSEEVEDEIQSFVKGYHKNKERLGDINFYYFEPRFSIKGVVASIIERENNDGVYVFASPSGEDKISLSAREDDDELDLSGLLKKAIDGLDEANAGGHPRAAGGAILREDLNKFKENIRNALNSD